MQSLYGVAQESPFRCKEFLEDFRGTLDEERQEALTFQFLGHGIAPDPGALVIFIPTFVLYRSHIKWLAEESDAVVFVFDHAVLLEHAEIQIIDARQTGEMRWVSTPLDYDRFVALLRSGLNSDDMELSEEQLLKRVEIVPKLFSTVDGGLAQMLFNLSQSCSRPAERRIVTRKFAEWVIGPEEVRDLEKALDQVTLDKDVLSRVERWFDSKQGQEARAVCRKLGHALLETSPRINYNQLTKGTSVPAFDLRYLVSQLRISSRIDRRQETSVESHKRRKVLYEVVKDEDK